MLKSIELEKAYNPKNFEDRVYTLWRNEGCFKPQQTDTGAETYTIVIPPPNVTGILHMGHALNITLQDIEIRFQRMTGKQVLWLPGCDHAGIATQNVVEKKLRERGLSRHELGREKFIEETWKVKHEHHAIISRQIAKMGASVDWGRERFTLDEGLSKAVREVFVTLYERGLLYKGLYLVNWCTNCGTALSDDEVEHEDVHGKMYHIRYPYADGSGFVEVATTRPETMFGDSAVAVHPEDERYTHLSGKMLSLPLTERKIPVVADTYVDRSFGTGALKITPAHDPNDWELGKRHKLDAINIITGDGKLNNKAPPKYRGLSMRDARKAVVDDLRADGFLIEEEDINHAVGVCYRCGTVIEPYLSEQWFVKMKPLAEKALEAWRRGEIVFYPRKWENTYKHWLENIRDWCVSRQLWWGHRIPAWTCEKCGKLTVSRDDISVCPYCGGVLKQDEDVLDTWFSSWLWPFSTLGWPDLTHPDFRRFYPTTALVTAYDIIFFWVSRMIMAGLEFTGKAPFRDIYIHGLLRDKQGRKMSKSLGNGIDPLELVDEYGADALKFTLAFLCAQGQDILIDKESFKLGSKFANKLWNASRYILMNLEGRSIVKNPKLLPVDEWIYVRLRRAAGLMRGAFNGYRYNEAAVCAYEFFWNDFCDWYVEATKLSTKREGDEQEKDRAVTVLLNVLAELLRLLHPLLPFVTEEIWGKLPEEIRADRELLITQRYPSGDCGPVCADGEKIESDFAFLRDLVRSIRTLRSECTIAPEKRLRAVVRTGRADIIESNRDLICLLAGLSEISLETASFVSEMPETGPEDSIALAGADFEAFLFIAEVVDMDLLKSKWSRELEKEMRFIGGLKVKLDNENFLRNAPAELAGAEKRKLTDAEARAEKIAGYLKRFNG
ncbi:MAG: valine--tRNA ligase [Spirochaetaceae bacterium]|jgi:valyl-tRNA synthetase|nr:valine--tRNA ligase [Spirochaetaceae bacterium]